MDKESLKELLETEEKTEAQIIVTTETKLRLGRLCRENQSYDDIIRILLDMLESLEKVGNIITSRCNRHN